MVDREARNKAAKVLQEFLLECSISNWQYDDRYPVSKADPAVFCVYQQIWFWYDDTHEHRMLGEYRLSPEHRDVIDRCLLFLESDLEYLWPPEKWNILGVLFDITKYVLSFGTLQPAQRETSYNEQKYWPFYDREQYEQAYS